MLSQIYTLSNSLPLRLLRYSGLPNKSNVRCCSTLYCLIRVPVQIINRESNKRYSLCQNVIVLCVEMAQIFKKKIKEKQAQRRAAAGRSRHKSHGVIQYQGSYFPTRCPKWIFIILIVLVEKKHTKLIYHMPWLYQYPPLPFHRSYKN